jgi:hypothetical protein
LKVFLIVDKDFSSINPHLMKKFSMVSEEMEEYALSEALKFGEFIVAEPVSISNYWSFLLKIPKNQLSKGDKIMDLFGGRSRTQ